MRCDQCRDAVSARLDGEDEGLGAQLVDAHLEGCAACRAFVASAQSLARTMRVRAAEDVPDLSGRILAAANAPAAPAREWPRYALLAVGLTQLVVALPDLVLGDARGASIHVSRELGAWDIAFAVGLLIVAWQPRRAAGLLPMAAALAAAMVVTAAFDVAAGRAPAIGEAHHVLDLAGLALLSMLVPHARDRGGRGGLRAARL